MSSAIKPTAQDAMDLWRNGNDAGKGYAPDDSTYDMTPYDAAEAAGMTSIETIGDTTAVLAWDVWKWVVIADCNGPWAVDVIEDTEGVANARLIAAAPELLAATKECADALADIINAAGNGQPYSPTELVELFADIRCRADAAYEKATGEKA